MPKYTMSDKRVFTDYHSSCELNKLIQQKYELQNSHEYRLFLQKNAEKIMKEFSQSANHEDCKLCPICGKATEYKPNGDINRQM